MSELKSYYVDFEKGYDVGDLYEHKGKEYEVAAIEAFNNLMLVVEEEFVLPVLNSSVTEDE